MKKKFIAIILALFVGTFGVHRFYLRQPELGVAYIALYIWLGRFIGFPISAILGWYDAYKLMMMDDQEFDRRYNSFYFRDRYGRRREQPRERYFRKSGKYIMLDESELKTSRQPSEYFKNLKKLKEAETNKQAGIRLFKEFDTKGAIQAFLRALENNPSDIAIHFNIACAYAIEEQALEAFTHLDKAVSLGFKDTQNIMKHEALAYIRVLPEFEQFKKNQFHLNADLISSIKSRENQKEPERLELKQELPVILNNPSL